MSYIKVCLNESANAKGDVPTLRLPLDAARAGRATVPASEVSIGPLGYQGEEMKKKKRPTDATLRNVRAAQGKILLLLRRVQILEKRVTRLERAR